MTGVLLGDRHFRDMQYSDEEIQGHNTQEVGR